MFYRNTSMCTYSYNKSLVEEDYRSRFEIYIDDVKTVKNRTSLNYIMPDKDELHKHNSGLKILQEVFTWFRNMNITSPNTTISGYDLLASDNSDFIEKTIRSFLTGIPNVVFEEITQEQAFGRIPDVVRKQIEKDIQGKCTQKGSFGFRMNIDGRLIFGIIKEGTSRFREVTFVRTTIGGEQHFSLREESEGTQRLLDLLPVLVTSKDNSVFVIA